MTPQEALLKAAALIEQPGRWTQGSYAKDRNGFPVSHTSKEAICFCMMGAVYKVVPYKEDNLLSGVRSLLRPIIGDAGPFNDAPGRTAQEVAEAMRKAAAL